MYLVAVSMSPAAVSMSQVFTLRTGRAGLGAGTLVLVKRVRNNVLSLVNIAQMTAHRCTRVVSMSRHELWPRA